MLSLAKNVNVKLYSVGMHGSISKQDAVTKDMLMPESKIKAKHSCTQVRQFKADSGIIESKSCLLRGRTYPSSPNSYFVPTQYRCPRQYSDKSVQS